MVAVIAGEAAGLLSSSRSILGQQGQFGQASLGQAGERVFVNAATGNLVVQGQDDRLSALGVDVGVLRTYNSLGSIDDGVGDDHWRLGFVSQVTLTSGSINGSGSRVSRIAADGAEQAFVYDAVQQTYVSTQGSGAHDTLAYQTNGTWVYTEGSSQVQMHYDTLANQGRLTAVLDAQGYGQRLIYTDGRVTQITTDSDNGAGGLSSETTQLNYNAAGQLISIALSSEDAERRTSYYYDYDSQGRLSDVYVDLNGDNTLNKASDVVANTAYHIQYGYEGSSDRLATITQSDGTHVNFTYDGQGRVKTITDGNAAVTTYHYDGVNTQTGKQETRVTVGGREYTFGFEAATANAADAKLQLAYQTAVVGTQEVTTTYAYDDEGNVSSITDGLGHQVTFGYDNGNQLFRQDAQGNRVEWRYNAANQQVAEAYFTQPDADGLQGPQAAGAPSTTRYVYDEAGYRLRFMVSDQGRVTEYRYNSLGQRSEQRVYTQAVYSPATALAPSADISQNALETWVAGVVAEQQAQGAGFDPQFVQLTAYAYDFRGHLSQQTLYEAVAANGNGQSDSAAVTSFDYDMHGRLLSERSPQGRVTVYGYDGLGRVVLETDTQQVAQGQVPDVLRSYVYDGNNQQIQITQQNGLITTQTFDRTGALVAVDYGLSSGPQDFGGEAYAYDEQGRQIAYQHHNGAVSYTFYDAAGRVQYQVDRAGAVTEYRYDAASQPVATHVYASLVVTEGWAQLDDQGRLTGVSSQAQLNSDNLFAHAEDRQSSHHFDTAGRKRFDIDAAGYATEYRYDGAGRLTQTRAYQEHGDVTVNNAGTVSISNAASYRVTRQFYTDDGQLAARIDSEGYLTQYHYDGAGQLIAETGSARAVDVLNGAGQWQTALAADIAEQTHGLSDFRAVADANDRTTHYRYDGRGLRIASVSPEGLVTRFDYNTDGLLRETREYSTRLTGLAVGQVLVFPVAQSTDHVTQYTYNERGQVDTETRQPENVRNTYFYDDQGYLIGTQTGAVTADDSVVDVRTQLIGVDALGRETGRLDGVESQGVSQIDPQSIATALAGAGSERIFDAQGRLVSTRSREGEQTFYYYDARNLLTATIASNGEARLYDYNAFGELSVERSFSQSLALNALPTLSGGDYADIAATLTALAQSGYQQVAHTYTQRGLQDITTDLAGGHIDRDYNAFGELADVFTRLTHAASSDVRHDQYVYDGRGLLTSSTVAAGVDAATTHTEYDAFGRVVLQRDANGQVTTTEYQDTAGQVLTHYTTANGEVNETTAYDVFGRTVQITDASGRLTTIVYDDAKREQITLQQGASESAGPGTKVIYNAHGQVTDIIRGTVRNNAISAADTLEHSQYTFDAKGNQLTEVRGYNSDAPLTVEYQYDKDNRRIAEIRDPDGVAATTTYRYDAQGRVLARVDAEGFITRYGYDGQGQLRWQLDAANSLTTYTYDGAGKRTSENRYDQDMSGSLNAWITALNSELLPGQEAVDKASVALSQTVIDGWIEGLSAHSRFTAYDAAGRMRVQIDAEQGVVAYHYNQRGSVTERVRYADATTLTSAQADQLRAGNLSETQLSDLLPSENAEKDEITASVYDANGQVRFSLQRLSDDALVKESRYDAAGRVVKTIAYAQTVAYNTEHSVDGLQAALTQANDSASARTTQLYYDDAGRLRFSIDSQGAVVETRYDGAGRATHTVAYATTLAAIDTDSKDGNSGRFNNDVLKAHFLNDTLTYAHLVTYLTDAGTLEADDRLTQTLYDGVGRVQQVIDAEGNAEHWSYYANGLKKTFTNKANQQWHYRYDDSGRLAREIGPAVEVYAKASGEYTAQANARLVQAFTYDGLGNVLTRTEGYIQATSEAAYASAALSDDKQTTTFAYDALGRQVLIVEPSATNAPPVTSKVTYDALGNAVVHEILTEDAQGTVQRIHSYKVFDGAGRAVFDVDALGYVTAYQYDAQGNLTEQTRDSDSIVGALSSWQPGEVLSQTQVNAALSALAGAGNTDASRTLTFEYDNLGRQIAVKQPSITYTSVVDQQGTLVTEQGRPETQFRYNAFGDVINTREKITNTAWADTFYHYDNVGRKTHTVDAQGYVSEWRYNALGEVQDYIEYAAGIAQPSADTVPTPTASALADRHWQYAYDGLGRRTHAYLLNNRVHGVETAQWLDAQGNASNLGVLDTSIAHSVTETAYDALGNVTTITRDGVTTTTAYDAVGRAIQVTEASDKAIADVEGLTEDIAGTNARLATVYRYDAFGNVVTSISGKLGSLGILNTDARVTTNDYNARNQLIETRDPAGDVTRLQYDFAGRITEQVRDYQLTAVDYTYSAQAQVQVPGTPYPVTSALPQWLTLDKHSGTLQGTATQTGTFTVVVTVRSEQGAQLYQESVVVQAQQGENVTIALPNWSYGPTPQDTHHAIHRIHYDALGQQLNISHSRQAPGSAAVIETHQEQRYNAFGEVVAKGNPLHAGSGTLQETYQYNAAGQLIAGTASDGNQQTYLYDLQGNRVQQSHPAQGEVVSQFDKLGRVLTQHQASYTVDGITLKPKVSQQYDRWGNVTSYTDARGNTTTYTYNHNNQIVQEKRPGVNYINATNEKTWGRPTFNNYYDIHGRLVARQDANGQFRFNVYNNQGQLTQTRDETGGITQVGYNVFGEQVAQQNALGYITTDKVDDLGRIIETGDIRVDDQGDHYYQALNQFTYDALGHRVIQRNALGHEYYYRYDTQGNLLYSLSPEGVAMAYAYDHQGNRTEETYLNLAAANGDLHRNVRTFDYFGRVQTLNDLGGNQYTYNYVGGVLDNRTLDLRGVGDSVDQVITYSYYENGQLRAIDNDDQLLLNSTSAPDAQILSQFTYNANGQITLEERETVNALGEITHELTETVYDSNGRIQRVTVYDKDNDDKILSLIEYAYDRMGNRRSMVVQNGYSGYIAGGENTAPVFHPDYEGLSYYPATRGFAYTYDMGEAADVFFDAEGDTLAYSLESLPGQSLPSWLVLDEQALNGQPPRLVLTSVGVVPNNAPDEISVLIKATEVREDDLPPEFTLLQVYLPVRTDLSPRFTTAEGFGELPQLQPGEEYAAHSINLNSVIEDPEGEALSFTIDWADSYSAAEIAQLEQWFVVDDNAIAEGTVVLASAEGQVVPNDIGAVVALRVIASDGARSTVFDLSLDVAERTWGDLIVIEQAEEPTPLSNPVGWENAQTLATIIDYDVGRTGVAANWLMLSKDADNSPYTLSLSDGVRAPNGARITVQFQKLVNGVIDLDVEPVLATFHVEAEYAPDQIDLDIVRVAAEKDVEVSLPAFTDVDNDITRIYFGELPAGVIYNEKIDAPLSGTLTVNLTYSVIPRGLTVFVEDSVGQITEYQWAIATHQIPETITLLEGDGSDDYWVNVDRFGPTQTFSVAIHSFGEGRPEGWVELVKDYSWYIRLVPDFSDKNTIPSDIVLRYTDIGTGEVVDFTVTVDPEYAPNSIILPPVDDIIINTPKTVDLSVLSDPDNDIVDIRINNLMDGFEFNFNAENPTASTVTGMATPATYPISRANVIVEDSMGHSRTYDWLFQLDVNQNFPPQVRSNSYPIVNEGGSTIVDLSGLFTDDGKSGQSLTYRLEGEVPTWVNQSDNLITISPTLGSASSTDYVFSVRASDGQYDSALAAYVNIAVNPVAETSPAIRQEATDSITLIEGQTWQIQESWFKDMFEDEGDFDIQFGPYPTQYMTRYDSGLRAEPQSGAPDGEIWVQAINASGGVSAWHVISVFVVEENQAPNSMKDVDLILDEGDITTVDLSSLFNDDGIPFESLSFDIVGAKPTWVSIAGSELIVNPLTGSHDAQPYTIYVRAFDGAEYSTSNSVITILVEQANQAPEIDDPIPDRAWEEGDTVTPWNLANYFRDGDNESLTFSASGLPSGLSVNTAGTLSGSLGFASSGSYTVTVTASDGEDSVSDTFTITVNEQNRNPVAGTISNRTFTENSFSSYDISSYFSDPDGDGLHFSASGLPSGVGISSTTGVISGTPGFNAQGNHTITVTASDLRGGTASSSFTLTVNDTNRGPYLDDPIPNRPATEGSPFSFSVANYFNDDDNDILNFSASGLPSGLSINSDGLISGTPTYFSSGSHSVTITASDGKGGSATDSFLITVTNVNRAPTAGNIPNKGYSEGQSVSYNVANYFSDPDGNSLTYSASGLPNGLSISSSGLISGTLSYTTAGSYSVSVSASDGSKSASDSFTLTVSDAVDPNANNAPSFNNAGTVSIRRGRDADISFDQYFSDSDGSISSYQVNGGGGLDLSNYSTIINGGRGINIENVYNDGIYYLSVTAFDNDGAFVSGSIALNMYSSTSSSVFTLQTVEQTDTFATEHFDGIEHTPNDWNEPVAFTFTNDIGEQVLDYDDTQALAVRFPELNASDVSVVITNNDVLISPNNANDTSLLLRGYAQHLDDLELIFADGTHWAGNDITDNALTVGSDFPTQLTQPELMAWQPADTYFALTHPNKPSKSQGQYSIELTLTNTSGVRQAGPIRLELTNATYSILNADSSSNDAYIIELSELDLPAGESHTLELLLAKGKGNFQVEASIHQQRTDDTEQQIEVLLARANGETLTGTTDGTVSATTLQSQPGSATSFNESGSSQLQSTALESSSSTGPLLVEGDDTDNILVGTSNAEDIYGYAGNDQLSGNGGADYLNGGEGDDIYTYNLGDGDVVIEDSSGADRLVFGAGITPKVYGSTTPANFVMRSYGLDLFILFPQGGSVQIKNWSATTPNSIEVIEFADGTLWADDAIQQTQQSESQVVGFETNDLLTGPSTFVSYLYGLEGDDVTVGLSYVNVIDAGDGNDLLFSVPGQNINGSAPGQINYFFGGKGDDEIIGGDYVNQYYFDPGNGNDTILNNGLINDLLLESVPWQEVEFFSDSNDMLISLNTTGETIRILDWYADSARKLGYIVFADGTMAGADAEYLATPYDPNTAPEVISIPTYVTNNVSAIALDLSQYFVDAQGDALTYTAALLVSDGAGGYTSQALPQGLNLEPSTGLLSGTVAQAGQYLLQVDVSDGQLSASQTFTLAVADAQANQAPQLTGSIPSIMVAEGEVVNQSLANYFSDPDGEPLTFAAVGLPSGLQLSADGLLAGAPTYTAAGGYTVAITAADGNGATVEATFTLTVNNTNRIPVFNGDNGIPRFISAEGNAFDLGLDTLLVDPDGEPMTFSAIDLPPGLSLQADGRIVGEFSYESAGSYRATVTATDASGAQVIGSVDFQVLNINRAPTLVSALSDLNLSEGDSVALDLSSHFVDADNDILTFSAVNLPTGLNLSTAGILSGTLPFDAAGSYNITVTADDGMGANVVDTFTLAVSETNRAPTAVTLASITANEGESLSIDIAQAFSDTDGDALTFNATGLPTGVTIDTATGFITGTAEGFGVFEISVTADDGELSVALTFELRILAASPFHYAITDGDVTIDNAGAFAALAMPDVVAANLGLYQDGDALLLLVKSTNNSVRLPAWYAADSQRIATLALRDTVLSAAEIDAAVMPYSAHTAPILGTNSGSDNLIGTDGADVILALDGHDTLDGQDGDDVLVGGQGDDTLYGRQGNDLIIGGTSRDKIYGGVGDDYLDGGIYGDHYYYNLGDGNDIIDDTGGISGNTDDHIFFGPGIEPEDIQIDAQIGGDMRVHLPDGATITIKNWWEDNRFNIQRFVFDDGTSWDNRAISSRTQVLATEEDDFVEFLGAGIRLNAQGGAGDDHITGGIYEANLSGGEGNDTLIAADKHDVLDGGIGNDYLNGNGGNDDLIGGLGNDHLIGGGGSDKLVGGLGDDILEGGSSSDKYYYDLGDGSDIIRDDSGDADRIVFGPSITPDNITLTADANNLTIAMPDGATITLQDWYVGGYSGAAIEVIEFADGTVWNSTTIGQNLTVIGTDAGDVMDYTSNNRPLRFDGGLGDDIISGGAHNNYYHYDLGDGSDVIRDIGGSTDQIVFGEGITPDAITLTADSQTLTITLPDGATITLQDWYEGGYSGAAIEVLKFADGTVWDSHTIGDRIHVIGTDSDDVMDYADNRRSLNFVGGRGNDVILGGHSTDYYHYSLGDGNDVIIETASVSDQIVFGNDITPDNITLTADANDLTILLPDGATITLQNWYAGGYSGAVIEVMKFADGTVWDSHAIGDRIQVMGTSGDDVMDYADNRRSLNFVGGLGDDIITGGQSTDYYHYTLGDGNDTLSDTNGTDHLYLNGISTSDVTYYKDADDLVLYITPSQEEVRVSNWYTASSNRIDNVHFDDSTTVSANSIEGLAIPYPGNQAPTTSGLVDTTANEGDTLSINAATAFTDADGDSLTFSATGLPTGITINAATGLISGNLDYASAGQYAITVVADDGNGGSVTAAFTITVANINQSPATSGLTDITANEGDTPNINAATAFTDADGDALTFSATGLPTGMAIDVETGFISGSLDYASAGDYPVTVTADDGNGGSVTAAFTITVANINQTPATSGLADITANEGDTLNINAATAFTDADGDDLTFSATGLPAGITIDATTGIISGSLGYASAGDYAITVTADDGNGGSVSASFSLAVANTNRAPEYTGGVLGVTLQAGDFLRQPVAFSDADGEPLTMAVTGLPTWLSFDAATQEVQGFAPQTVQGAFPLIFSATDSQGETTQVTFTVTVEPRVVQSARVQLQNQQVTYNSAFSYNVASHFSGLGAGISYVLEERQTNGTYAPLPVDDWLQFSDGVFSGTPALGDVTVGRSLRLTATDALGDSVVGEFSVQVQGPAAKTLSTVEAVNTEVLRINASDYFVGLSGAAQFGVIVELASSDTTQTQAQTSSLSTLASLDDTQSLQGTQTAFALQSLATSDTSTASNTPDVVIPPELAVWLSFDAQTGLLTGLPPQDFVDQLKLTFLAQDGEVTLTSQGAASIGEEASQETHWFTYDAAGRVQIDGGALEADGTVSINGQGRYLAYDKAGRNTLSISEGGYTAQFMTYSAQGWLTGASQTYGNSGAGKVDLFAAHTQQDTSAFNSVSRAHTVTHSYNLTGQVTDTLHYFTPGRHFLVSNVTSHDISGPYDVNYNLTNQASEAQRFAYTADGQIERVETLGWGAGDLERVLRQDAELSGPNPSGTPLLAGALNLEGRLLNTQDYDYDNAGRLDDMTYNQVDRPEDQPTSIPATYTHFFDYSYTGRESYLETQVNGRELGNSGNGDFEPGTTQSFYDASGNRLAVEETNDAVTTVQARYFDYSADNQLVKKVSGRQDSTHAGKAPEAEVIDTGFGNGQIELDGPATVANTVDFQEDTQIIYNADTQTNETRATTSHYLYSGGQYLGELNETGAIRIKQQHFSGVDVQQADSSQRHQVRSGDTLRSLSVLFYGTGDYWYIIADANGLSEDSDVPLTAGQTLEIPQQAQSQNRFDSFSTYSITEQIGDTLPNLPFVPAPPEAGCSVIATVLIVAVTIIAAAATAGAAAGATSNFISSGFKVLAGNFAGASAAIGTTVTTGTGLAAAAAGGAVGAIAGQATGIATGQRDGFSLKDIAAGALTAGATAGIGSAVRGAALFKSATSASGISAGGAAAIAAGGTLSSAAANKLVGNPSGFSWAAVAGSAVSAGVSQRLGLTDNSIINGGVATDGTLVSDTLGGIARAGINYSIQKAFFNKGSWDFANVAADAFGNALANSVARRSTASGSAQTRGSSAGQGGQAVDPDIGGFSPVGEFDPQAAYQRQQVRQQAAENLSASAAGINTIDFTPTDFTSLLASGAAISNAQIDTFFQNQNTAAFLQRQALTGDRLSSLRAGLAPGVFDGIQPANSGGFFSGLYDTVIGAGDILFTGAVNSVVDIAGGVASIPFALFDGVDAAVAVQNSFRDRLGLSITSDGGRYAVDNFFAPAGGFLNENIFGPTTQFLEDTIGLGATSFLTATGQAGLEIGGLLLGYKGATSIFGSRGSSVDSSTGSAPNFTFRGDSRGPDIIFNEGFQTLGDSNDLFLHALDNRNPPSNFISTSNSLDVANSFNSDNIYVIRPVGGIDVNAVLGSRSPFPRELEIAIPNGVDVSDIRAVTLPDQGVSILNPNYRR